MNITAYTIIHNETNLPLRKKYWTSITPKREFLGFPRTHLDENTAKSIEELPDWQKPYTEKNDMYLAGSKVGAERTLKRLDKVWPNEFSIVPLVPKEFKDVLERLVQKFHGDWPRVYVFLSHSWGTMLPVDDETRDAIVQAKELLNG